MVIRAQLRGGPWDGERLKLNAEVPYINMPEPLKTPDRVGQVSIDRLENIYQYRLYKLMPDGELIYQIA